MTSPAIRPGSVALVAAGGAAGTLCRWGVSQVFPTGALPWPTLAVNLLGAFALGLLLEDLSRPTPESARARTLRLLFGTGFLGGFTTFSSMALELVRLAAAAEWATMWVYAGSSLVGGVLAAWLGITVAARGPGRAVLGGQPAPQGPEPTARRGDRGAP